MSPDGKWVAYNSNESGRSKCTSTPFPATGERFTVSREQAATSRPGKPTAGRYNTFTPDGVLNAVKSVRVGLEVHHE